MIPPSVTRHMEIGTGQDKVQERSQKIQLHMFVVEAALRLRMFKDVCAACELIIYEPVMVRDGRYSHQDPHVVPGFPTDLIYDFEEVGIILLPATRARLAPKKKNQALCLQRPRQAFWDRRR